ncbi:class I SAM-dependent methyltransferase [Dactylosporangium sp. NPDC000244]|uniref:class I SAM-dependent methyltransferase n=1 Tax=Dactylosporangium sp. NPDC000244 TaxID=3154365 RepID=UPI003324563C
MYSVETIIAWYREHADALRAAREEQRELLAQGPMRPKLDDIEAEISYLTVRALRPHTVVEIGSYHGWSTSWLLRALRDNGGGVLHTYDRVDHARRSLPDELTRTRWRFVRGDVRAAELPGDPGFVFVDALHTAGFARWYTAGIFERLKPGVAVAVHDVYHGRRPWPNSEGAVLLRWLRERGIGHLTASRHGDPDLHDHLAGVKRRLRLAAPVHNGTHDPMAFFSTPEVSAVLRREPHDRSPV